MKKYILSLIVILNVIFISNVNAVESSATVIGSNKYGDLICSYVQKDNDSGEWARASIYYNKDKGTWAVLSDTTISKDDWTKKNKPDAQSGKFDKVFSKKGTNVYIDDSAKESLRSNFKCPAYGGVRTSGVNRPCFGNDSSHSQCKMNKKHAFSYTLTYNYRDNMSSAEIAALEGNMSQSSGGNLSHSADFDSYIGDGFCYDSGVRKALKIVGYMIVLARFFTPILVIVLGSLDLFKSVTNGTMDIMKKQFKTFGIRLVIGLCVFFIPVILHGIFSATEVLPLEYEYCETCLLSPEDC